MNTPLTTAEAYVRSVQLRQLGFTSITAIDLSTGRRIADVARLLKDLGA